MIIFKNSFKVSYEAYQGEQVPWYIIITCTGWVHALGFWKCQERKRCVSENWLEKTVLNQVSLQVQCLIFFYYYFLFFLLVSLFVCLVFFKVDCNRKSPWFVFFSLLFCRLSVFLLTYLKVWICHVNQAWNK